MSDRVYASLFYIVLIVGSSWIAVALGEGLTREALTKLALLPSHNSRPSRVEIYMAAQERPDEPKLAKKPLIPAAPALTVGELAKGMDDAEHTSPEQTSAASASVDAPSPPTAVPEAKKPRVAGWSKRISKRDLAASDHPAHEETSNRIIMRALRAEM